jgi:hypothetical protein
VEMIEFVLEILVVFMRLDDILGKFGKFGGI